MNATKMYFLGSLWLDFEPNFRREITKNVDKISLGGDINNRKNIDLTSLPTLNETIEQIKKNWKKSGRSPQLLFRSISVLRENV